METIFNFRTEIINGYITRVVPNVYAVVIKDNYDRGMLFCRYQEFYESPYTEIRGRYFTLEFFMWLYRKKTKKRFFTYFDDFAGYNIPSDKFEEAYTVFYKCDDDYNQVMRAVFDVCLQDAGLSPSFYVMGVDNIKGKLFEHEFAHALYYINNEYRKRMNDAIDSIDKVMFNKIKKILINLGYSRKKEIIYDEIQAYLSTGIDPELNIKGIKRISKNFESVYKEFRII
jgi:hypothetical protein